MSQTLNICQRRLAEEHKKNNITGLLTASSAVMMESFFDKSDMDLASIDCSCRPVMSVCNRQQTKHYEMKLAVDGKPGREWTHAQTDKKVAVFL